MIWNWKSSWFCACACMYYFQYLARNIYLSPYIYITMQKPSSDHQYRPIRGTSRRWLFKLSLQILPGVFNKEKVIVGFGDRVQLLQHLVHHYETELHFCGAPRVAGKGIQPRQQIKRHVFKGCEAWFGSYDRHTETGLCEARQDPRRHSQVVLRHQSLKSSVDSLT